MGCCASEQSGIQDSRLEDAANAAENITKQSRENDPSKMGAPKNDPTAGRKKKYAKNPAILLGYWKCRGVAQPIRFMLEYTEHPY